MMDRFDILVVGELNVDLILNRLPSLPEEGKEILAKEMTLTLGSSSAIFASNASTLGNKVAFIGKIGNDSFGDLVVDSLEKKKVNTQLIIKSSSEKTGATIVLNYGENRAMVTHPGAMETMTLADIHEDVMVKARHMHVSSIYLQPGIKNDIVKLFKKAKSLGLTTSLDMQWDPEEKWDIDVEKLLPLVDVFLPNETELLLLTKQTNLDDAISTIKPYINTLAVKMGSAGSRGVVGDKDILKAPYLNNKVVDAIGAGDSFNAGFITKFLTGEPLEECLRYGNLAGAVNTTAAGGTGAFGSLKEFRVAAREHLGV